MLRFVKYCSLLLLAMSSLSHGHNLKMASVLIEQKSLVDWSIHFKVTHPSANLEQASLVFPARCLINAPIKQKNTLRAVSKTWHLVCDQSAWLNSINLIGIKDPATQLVVQTKTLDSKHRNIQTSLIQSDPQRIIISNLSPNLDSASSVKLLSKEGAVKQYLTSGFRHIAEGFDHLVFLFLMLLISTSPRKLALIVTGFTVGHAITLTMITMNLFPDLHIKQNYIECLIALSIVFLASEIIRGRSTLTLKHPATIAVLFGLVHGLGFASALQAIELPTSYQILALISFNLGVEIAQLSFVFLCFYALKVLTLASETRLIEKRIQTTNIKTLTSYLLGSIGSYWLVLRLITA